MHVSHDVLFLELPILIQLLLIMFEITCRGILAIFYPKKIIPELRILDW